MDGVEFYQKHVQFNENISRIQMERAKLEQEFFSMSRSNKTSKSLRLAHLRNYYKQACEREKRSITRNRALVKEFKDVETKLKSLESQTQKLQNMRKTYEQEITRLYPQWRQKVEIAKAQRQLEELGFHHGRPAHQSSSRESEGQQQDNIVQPILGNTVSVAAFSNASMASSHPDSLRSPTPEVVLAPSPQPIAGTVQASRSSKPSVASTPASISEHVSSVSSGLVNIRPQSTAPTNDVVQSRSASAAYVPSSNVSANESPSVSEHHTISSRQEMSLPPSIKDDVIEPSLSSQSNKVDVDITVPSSRSSSVPAATPVVQSLPPQPQQVPSRQGSITRAQSSLSNATASEKSEVSRVDSSVVNLQSGSTNHPSESSASSVQQKVSVSGKDSAKHSSKDPVGSVGQRYDDAPYSYADDDSFNISDEASDSFDSELSDPASRKVIQVKESSHSALNSISDADGRSGPNSRGSPSKSGPIVIPGVDNLNDTGDSNLTDSITSNMTSPRTGPLTSSAAYKALVMKSPTGHLEADDFSDEEDELEDVLSPTSKSHFDEFGKSTASSDSIAEKTGKNQPKTSSKSSDNKPVSAVSLDSKTSQKKKAYKAPWETDSEDDDYSFQESSAKNNPALDDDDDDDFDFYD